MSNIIIINLSASTFVRQLNCDRISVHRVMIKGILVLIGAVILTAFGYFLSKRKDNDD